MRKIIQAIQMKDYVQLKISHHFKPFMEVKENLEMIFLELKGSLENKIKSQLPRSSKKTIPSLNQSSQNGVNLEKIVMCASQTLKNT